MDSPWKDIDRLNGYFDKWQTALRLRDWDIQVRLVEKPWRKSGDIKIDRHDHTAILLINNHNPRQTNLEELIIHELLHLKLWDMDQLIETLMNTVYGEDEGNAKRGLVYDHFMTTLESTVNDLAKSFLEQSGGDKKLSYGRLEQEVAEELGEV
jgi:hypothetical protein